MSDNKADLFQPIAATRVGSPPLVIRAIVTDNNDYLVGGVPQSTARAESYVLLSALPRELQERIKVAVNAIISGM